MLVRKHRAPKGALRLRLIAPPARSCGRSQKAPSAKRCIKTRLSFSSRKCAIVGQKAPSAKRRIKTRREPRRPRQYSTGQKAPRAKRCIKICRQRPARQPAYRVRKHRAPKGALRRNVLSQVRFLVEGEKPPSAKRCIKTRKYRTMRCASSHVRKHRAPKGALRPPAMPSTSHFSFSVRKHLAPKGALRREPPVRQCSRANDSQKAPSAKRCIKTRHGWCQPRLCCPGSESTEHQKVH